ncbi:hypothetical protein [Lentisalinibacter orientalis]|uniref:hypothetical protein n=1 Tax=Lentisalinibacter orientalis TaxID=2992241 RepID=UPI00386EDAB6
MSATTMEEHTLPLEAVWRIQAILPDDGTDRELMERLRREHDVNRADSVLVRGVAALQEAKTRRGRLPESSLARLVTILVAASEAHEVFDYVYVTARIGRPGGGVAILDRLSGATVYRLPSAPEESQGPAAR